MQQYVVGFRVFDGRSLQSEDGGLCDPFVVVECCGNTYQTEVLENRATSSLVPWNEGCIWPSVELSPAEFQSASVHFTVYARYWWSRNYVIGKASLQMSFVNKRKRHLYARRWLCLRREDSPKCTGMLNVTLYVLEPGNHAPSATEQMELMEDPEEDKDEDQDDLSKAVLKPTVEAPPGNPHHVRITISRVEDLVDLGGFGGAPSPYVTVEFADCLVSTAVAHRVKVFTFNEEILIPVTTPVYEDTIIIKLWSSNMLSPDELLAQGLISFSELRNNALPPRWFNLYGWNTDEASQAANGTDPDPNYFKGRLLVSGRVDRLKPGDELQKATHAPSRPVIDPSMIMLALLADVYLVTGAEGRNCRVEVSFGSQHKATEMVGYDSQPVPLTTATAQGMTTEDEDGGEKELQEDVNTFSFSDKAGRLEPLLILATEDPLSQPYVMINVYTDGYLQSYQRIAYAKCYLHEFPTYEQGNPSKPRFIALEPMPGRSQTRIPPSVLITIEKHPSDDVVRHLRRRIKPMLYIVRAYCFLARQIKYDGMSTEAGEPDEYGLRVTCAGVSRTTQLLAGPRPMWMQPLDLKVILCSDSPKEPPTIEPVAVTLVRGGSIVNSDLGKAVCVYTHMRQRDNLGQWEPYSLDPQWIKVFGGTYGKDAVGEVLIGFELMLWKFREEMRLQPRQMWPQPEEIYDRAEHLCCLRKATLHFSMHGLRDLAALPNMESLGFMSGWSHPERPTVEVNVSPFYKKLDERLEDQVDKVLSFNYEKVKPGGDERVQADLLRTWTAPVGTQGCRGHGAGANFEFLQVGTMQVLIPDSRLLQPYVTIKVYEKPSEGLIAGALGYTTKTLIGESLQSLNPVLPCVWLEDVTLDKPYADQKQLISDSLRRERLSARARDHFRQWTPDEMRIRLLEMKEAMTKVTLKIHIVAAKGLNDVHAFDQTAPYCTCEVVGKPHTRIKTSPLGDMTVTVWNWEGKITDFNVDDSLLFALVDRNQEESGVKEPHLAKAVLSNDQVYPLGFEGEVPLLVVPMHAPTPQVEGEKKGAAPTAIVAAAAVASLVLKVDVVQEGHKQQNLITLAKQKSDFLNSEGLPLPLRTHGLQRRGLQLLPVERINREADRPFTPRKGVEIKPLSGESRGHVGSKLENSKEKPFIHDFWYKNMPLLRNHDIVADNQEDVDYNYQPGLVFGFVKCTFKVVDGWDDDAAGQDQAGGGEEDEEEEEALLLIDETDDVKLKRSFEFDPHLDLFAFNQQKLHQHFKSPNRIPSRVRVRLYFVKAVCIFSKTASFADPYLTFQLGRDTSVSMKNMVKPQTNTPDFYHFEERDVQLPFDSRLEINVMDLEDISSGNTGSLIGSTVIDLEDRWHSRVWRKINRLMILPIESRSLHTSDYPGKNRGSLEMWVEMIETTKASDQKPSDIRKPADLEVEVRLVIWGASKVPPVKDDYTNAKITTMLDCKEYNGEYSKNQETDVHFACREGRAVFAWRIVYPNIQMPVFSCAVQFSLYHSELLAGDTFMGSFNLDLKKYMERVSKDMMARETGPTDLKFMPEDTSKDASEFDASVNVSLYVLTQMEANTKRQGAGRDEPNDNPQLITPTEGREWGDYLSTLGFSLPDLGLWKKLIPLLIAAAAFLVSVIALRQMGLL